MRLRRLHSVLGLAAVLFWGSLLAVRPAEAQRSGQKPAVYDEMGIDERLSELIPLDATFQNEAGQLVPLSTFFDGERPVLLSLVYHDCPMLCNIVLDKLTGTLKAMEWVPGQEFDVLTVSFNAIETPELAARQKARYVQDLGKPEAAAGWHFLTGDSTAIHALTGAVGFRFQWVEERQEFAHPAALIFLDGEGRIMRYLYGIDFPPRDVRTALVEASAGKVGTAVDQILLYCFQYDPNANSYVPHAINIMKIGGLLTMLILGLTLVIFWRREGQQHRAGATTPS